ncbi:MAG: YhcH/YjgK/YiaL family protein [Paludibacteraceae bacterium]|nr:YhcH/YjgK/YiaL family protein [Paludibacteraceae bacterium]
MIIDSLENFSIYEQLHPNFKKVGEILRNTEWAKQPKGRMTFDTEDFYINVDESQLKDLSAATPEVHDKYIDIQLPIARAEQMGWLPRSACKTVHAKNPDKDYTLYEEHPEAVVDVKPGQFVIFFPNDAHAPLIGEGQTKKVIAKIKVQTNI